MSNFDNLTPTEQRKLVCEFLLAYSKWDLDMLNAAVAIVTLNCVKYSIDYRTCSKLAVSFIQEDHFKARKFEMLVEHLKKQGMERFYHYTMGENISEALK